MARIIITYFFALILLPGGILGLFSKKHQALAILRLPICYLLLSHASDLRERRAARIFEQSTNKSDA